MTYHHVSLPVPNPTRAFWATSPDPNPIPSIGSTGPLIEDADVCIIGSGITGVSAAYHLAKILRDRNLSSGLVKVLILEARDFCSGATGRNGGHLTETRQFFSEFGRVEKQQGVGEAVRAKALESRNVQGIIAYLRDNGLEEHVDLVQGGLLTLFVTNEEYKTTRAQYEAAKTASIDLNGIEWLSEEETQARFGASFPAMLSPGNNIWPSKLVGALYNSAKEIGMHALSNTKLDLSIHTHTPVTAIDPHSQPNSQRRYTLSTSRGPIACSYILHATNGYVSHLLPHMGGPEGVIPTRGQVIATRAKVPSEVLTTVAGSANEDYEYWFPRSVRKDQSEAENPVVILGGGREVTLPEGEAYVTDDSTLNPEVSKFLRQFLPHTFPGRYEAGQEPEMEWTGIMGFTKSTNPFVGPVIDRSKSPSTKFEGQYLSAGYTGHGMPRAFACAEAVAQMIVADIEGKDWEIPEWFPRSYLTC